MFLVKILFLNFLLMAALKLPTYKHEKLQVQITYIPPLTVTKSNVMKIPCSFLHLQHQKYCCWLQGIKIAELVYQLSWILVYFFSSTPSSWDCVSRCKPDATIFWTCHYLWF